MTELHFGHLRCVALLGFMLALPGFALPTESLILSGVQLKGTKRLTTEDVIRGLDLKIGAVTSRQSILQTCDRFQRLKVFESSRCEPRIEGKSLLLTIVVNDRCCGTPVVFDNFVWATRQELLARLKHGLPLFMPELPIHTGLANDITRVLQQVAAEHGIHSQVKYDDRYWTNRGMNVFFIEGISTPVRSLQIEGENSPPAQEVKKWSEFYTKEEFAAARLTWVTNFVLRDLYAPRGYLRANVTKSDVQPLPEKDGTYPVRVVLYISSGNLYTFDSVKFEGFAKEHSAALLAKWTLKPGAPYNPAYVENFAQNEILSSSWAQHGKFGTDVALPCAKIDEASRAVSLTISVEAPKKTYTYLPAEGDYKCGEVISNLTLH